MSTCINSGWAKLDKYYALTSETPAYVGALVLHPAYKWQYIEEHWLREWWGPAKAALQGLWEEKYAPTGLDRLPAQTYPHAPSRASTTTSAGTPNKFTEWKNSLKAKVPTTMYQDEYARYCGSSPHHDFEDVRDWWLAAEQQAIYPNLSRMALNLLSIPAMSAEPERLFSSCKITITDRRNKLSVKVIEALECLRSWYKVEAFELDELVEE
jgi:hAT family C-terminal dimerisation region